MTSDHQMDIGSIMSFITDESLYHRLQHLETEPVTKVRSAINIALFSLLTKANLTIEEITEKIQERENICFWFTEKEFPENKRKKNTIKRAKLRESNRLPRASVCAAAPGQEEGDVSSSAASNTSLPDVEAIIVTPRPEDSAGNGVNASASMSFGDPGKDRMTSSLFVEVGDVDEDPGGDQQVLASNLLDATKRRQIPNATLTELQRNNDALVDTIEELVKQFIPSGNKYPAVNQIINNNKINLKKRLTEIIQNGEHVIAANLGAVVYSIANKLLPTTSPQFQDVFSYLLSAARQPKRSKFGAIMHLMINYHTCTPGCSEI